MNTPYDRLDQGMLRVWIVGLAWGRQTIQWVHQKNLPLGGWYGLLGKFLQQRLVDGLYGSWSSKQNENGLEAKDQFHILHFQKAVKKFLEMKKPQKKQEELS